MTSNLAAIVTAHHQTCLKLRTREKRTTTENVMFYRPGKNSEKPQTGVAIPAPPPLYVRGLI